MYQKRQYAQETISLAREGGPRGPDLMEYIRKRMLLLAEGEILEESWFKSGTSHAWPAASRIAADCYVQVIRLLQQRHERFTAATVFEDLLQFSTWQHVIPASEVVDGDLLEEIVMMVASYASQPEPPTLESQPDWIHSLQRLYDASHHAQLTWSHKSNRRAGVAFLQNDQLDRGLAIFTSQLTSWWRQRQDGTMVSQGVDCSDSGSTTRSLHTLARHIASSLARSRSRVLQSSRVAHLASSAYRRQAANHHFELNDYLGAIHVLAEHLAAGRLPLPPVTRSSDRQPPFPAAASDDIMKELFAEYPNLCRFHNSVVSKSEQRLRISPLLDGFMTRYFQGKDSQFRTTVARFSARVYNTLLRYALRYFRDVESKQLSTGSPQTSGACRSALARAVVKQLTRSTTPGRPLRLSDPFLTVLLNEATRQRLDKLTNSVFKLMLLESSGHRKAFISDDPGRSPSANQIHFLVQEAKRRHDIDRLVVLLRYITATGRLKPSKVPGKPESSAGFDEGSESSSRDIDVWIVVNLIMKPTQKQKPSVGQGMEILNRSDAWALASPAVMTSLLNIAAKSGSWPLVDQLWHLVTAFSKAALADKAELSGLPGGRAEKHLNTRVITVSEATSYFQSHAERVESLIRKLFPAPFSTIVPPDEKAGPVLQPEDRTKMITQIVEMREAVRQGYEELLLSWDQECTRLTEGKGNQASFVPPMPDEKFFRAVLGAAGYGPILKIAHIADRTLVGTSHGAARDKGKNDDISAVGIATSAPIVKARADNRASPATLLDRFRACLEFLGLQEAAPNTVDTSSTRYRSGLSSLPFLLQVLADMVLVHRIVLPTGIEAFLRRCLQGIQTEIEPCGSSPIPPLPESSHEAIRHIIIRSSELAGRERSEGEAGRRQPETLTDQVVADDFELNIGKGRT